MLLTKPREFHFTLLRSLLRHRGYENTIQAYCFCCVWWNRGNPEQGREILSLFPIKRRGALKKQEDLLEAGPLKFVHLRPQGMWKENGQKVTRTKRTRKLSFQRGQSITYKAKNLPYQENTFYPDLPLFERKLKSILSFLRKL